jgi:hypothetical protein
VLSTLQQTTYPVSGARQPRPEEHAQIHWWDTTRPALENAASVASMILTTEALVTEKPEKEKPPAPAASPGMDY